MNKLVSSGTILNCMVRNIRSFSASTRLNSNIFNVQDDDDFATKVLKNNKPVIVDFHAGWCGPCKILGPRLEKIMANYDGKVDMAKVDVDDLPDLAMNYQISAMPTVIAIKDGKEIGKFVGLKEADILERFVKDALEK